MLRRPRRNRKSFAIRSLVQETTLLKSDLVAPFFVIEGKQKKEHLPQLPGCFQFSIDLLLEEAKKLHAQGLQAIALFPVIDKAKKNDLGSYALENDNLIIRAIQEIKAAVPTLCIISDIALDPYTSHGHDGVINESQDVANDKTVEILAQMSILHAKAGVDMVAPSDMMDGRVQKIRESLDSENFQDVSILSYAAKYTSSLYAPYRDTLSSHVTFGSKKSYQMNPANQREALLEAFLDEQEGADILMVKPALFYLDVIAKIRMATNLPICAFHVSGEYAMVMAAEEKGLLISKDVFYEALLSIKRAGADFIISYATPIILPIL